MILPISLELYCTINIFFKFSNKNLLRQLNNKLFLYFEKLRSTFDEIICLPVQQMDLLS